jgi:hypothetical protein
MAHNDSSDVFGHRPSGWIINLLGVIVKERQERDCRGVIQSFQQAEKVLGAGLYRIKRME